MFGLEISVTLKDTTGKPQQTTKLEYKGLAAPTMFGVIIRHLASWGCITTEAKDGR